MLSTDFVIRSRQAEIVNEVHDIEDEIRSLQKQIEMLTNKRDLRIAEHDLLDRVDDRNIIVGVGKSTTRSRMNFEDCVKQIFTNIGRPMKMSELISELEKFGYIWSTYQAAYAYILHRPVLEKVSRGWYQYLK